MEEISTRKMQPTKKRKISKWLKGFILLFLIIIAIHFNFYFAIKKEFNANQSVNPEATSYFIHANIIGTVYIGILHKIFDYDSLAMKPLLQLTDYYFEKGEKLVKTDNGEDGVWWYLTYAKTYSFSNLDRKDESLNFLSQPKDIQKSIRDKMFFYAFKISKNGIKGLDFRNYERTALNTYFNLYDKEMYKMYNGNNTEEQWKKYWEDVDFYIKTKKLYDSYEKYYELNLGKKDFYYEYFLFKKLHYILYRNLYVQKINNVGCNSLYIKKYLITYDYLLKNIDILKKKDFLKKNYIENNKVFDSIEMSCKNYLQEMNRIKSELNQIKGEIR